MNLVPSDNASLTDRELDQLREALRSQFPFRKQIVGAQLGAFVRRHLEYPDIKGRFGGLRKLLSQHFSAEITWREKRGLDDVYELTFAPEASESNSQNWQPTPTSPSPWLWSAVTNPSIQIEFAWERSQQQLFHAPSATPIGENLTVVGKLTRGDYQQIAKEFLTVSEQPDQSSLLELIGKSESSVPFTTEIRERGLLPIWEAFRVRSAIAKFGERLAGAGAQTEIVAQWENHLKAAQRLGRSRKLAGTVDSEATPGKRSQKVDGANESPNSRQVARKALEYLSEAELNELRLPFGSVMQAVRALLKSE